MRHKNVADRDHLSSKPDHCYENLTCSEWSKKIRRHVIAHVREPPNWCHRRTLVLTHFPAFFLVWKITHFPPRCNNGIKTVEHLFNEVVNGQRVNDVLLFSCLVSYESPPVLYSISFLIFLFLHRSFRPSPLQIVFGALPWAKVQEKCTKIKGPDFPKVFFLVSFLFFRSKKLLWS